MANYKRKPRAGAKRAPVKRRTTVRRPSQPKDGQNILVSAYFEAHKQLGAAEDSMSYTICLDPKVGAITAGNGVTFKDGGDGAGANIATGTNLSFNKYNTFATLFNQYKVNSAIVKVRTDANCGLENAVICSNDKGSALAVTNMSSALQGAHKSYSMTQSKRELTYGCKNTGQELDYRSTAAGQVLIDAEKKYIKVFQKIPSNAAGAYTCEHQVQVMLSCSLKDSKNILN